MHLNLINVIAILTDYLCNRRLFDLLHLKLCEDTVIFVPKITFHHTHFLKSILPKSIAVPQPLKLVRDDAGECGTHQRVGQRSLQNSADPEVNVP